MATLKAALLYWKLAIFRVMGKALVAMVLSAAQALNGLEWSAFNPTQKFICVALAVGTGWAIIDAFLDQTLSRIEHNPDNFGIDATHSATQKIVTQTTKTEIASTPTPAVPSDT